MKNKFSIPKLIDTLLDDILPVVPYIGQWLIMFCVDIGVALVHPFGKFVRGQKTLSIFDLAFQLIITLVRYPVQFILTIGSLFLNAIASLINHVLSDSHERVLTIDERRYLQTVFGNSVNYDAVRIQFGGVKEALGISPQAVGNDVFMRELWGERTAYPDKTLTAAGMRLLGHEIAHVWQYQHTGAGYIGDSLMTQTLDVVGCKLGIRLSDGYDLQPVFKHAYSIDECNVEQQAVMAEMLCVTCNLDKCESPTRASFNRVSGFALNEEEFRSAKAGHAWFRNKC